MTKKQSNTNYKIAFIASTWHADLVKVATDSARSELAKSGVDTKSNFKIYQVPGSLEIPLFAKTLAKSNKWDAIIGFGLIVDGGIYRHEFVAQAVVSGIVDVSLMTDIPILSVALTPQKFDENNPDDIKFFKNHLRVKGREAAVAAINILNSLKQLS